MKRTPKQLGLQSPSFFQLSIPFHQKPFLETKKKLRGKETRAAFEAITNAADVLKRELEQGTIKSSEARGEIREFLTMIGIK